MGRDDSSLPRRLVTVKGACAYGKIGVTELYAYLNDGSVKAYKRRTTTLVDLNTLDAFYATLPPYFPREGKMDAKTKTDKAAKIGKK